MKRKKKRKQKTGTYDKDSDSKYAIKKQLQAKGIYSRTSPFKVIRED